MRCCCDVFHITTGAKILACLIIIGAVGSFVTECFPSTPHTPGERAGVIIGSIFQLVSGVLVFVGCQKSKANLIIPMIVYTILMMFVAGFVCLAVLVAPIASGDTAPLVIAAALVIALYVWFFVVFKNCHKYLRELENSLDYSNIGV